MLIYWLDSSVLIEAEKSKYPRALFPSFWTFLHAKLAEGVVCMPKQAFDEICDGNDRLAEWCKPLKDHGLCTKSSKAVQVQYAAIADHVHANHAAHQVAKFLKGADGWVIAHALVSAGVVVTEEKSSKGSEKIKIPDVCAALGGDSCNLLRMLARLGFGG